VLVTVLVAVGVSVEVVVDVGVRVTVLVAVLVGVWVGGIRSRMKSSKWALMPPAPWMIASTCAHAAPAGAAAVLET
jgi:hypothetical protein